jgi:uncharacterized membrane protein
MRMNVGKWERIGSMAAGAALLYIANRQQRRGNTAAATAAGLMFRGVTGYCPVNALIGRDSRHRLLREPDSRAALAGPRGVHVLESIVLNADAPSVYRFWRDLSNLPRFMGHLQRVEVIDSTRSHWVALAPAGMTVEWDAEIINDVENKLIGWKSVGNPDVVSAGSVRFRPVAGGTEVTVHMQYDPPAGKLGSWIAAIFGSEPSQTIRQDLWRLKAHFDGVLA